jgi:hypothetical protein
MAEFVVEGALESFDQSSSSRGDRWGFGRIEILAICLRAAKRVDNHFPELGIIGTAPFGIGQATRKLQLAKRISLQERQKRCVIA